MHNQFENLFETCQIFLPINFKCIAYNVQFITNIVRHNINIYIKYLLFLTYNDNYFNSFIHNYFNYEKG
jgi:hypothetical protein